MSDVERDGKDEGRVVEEGEEKPSADRGVDGVLGESEELSDRGGDGGGDGVLGESEELSDEG